MAEEKTNKSCFHYRMTHKGQNYSTKDFWQPGDSLRASDIKILEEVREFYLQKGYPPTRADLSHDSVWRLKERFRTWKNVILAAGLPSLNSKEVQNIKQNI